MTMDENAFKALAGETLARLAEAVEEALGDRLDVDLEEGILSIELETGAQYVINGHAPSRQIWMASPVSGGSHFAYDDGRGKWTDTRGEASLGGLLAGELEAATGIALKLD